MAGQQCHKFLHLHLDWKPLSSSAGHPVRLSRATEGDHERDEIDSREEIIGLFYQSIMGRRPVKIFPGSLQAQGYTLSPAS